MPKNHFLLHLLLSRVALGTPQQRDGEIVVRDVCIIGGGSSGTYSAIQLHDMGKSVVVLEREGILGGQVDTYRDPITNATYDYGAKSFILMDVVTDYFTRLGVEWEPFSLPMGEVRFVDFRQREILPDYTLPNSTAARRKFDQILDEYSYLDYGFLLPDPIPDDLLLPFGDFIHKHEVESVVNPTWKGLGDTPQQMTLYILKAIAPTAKPAYIWTRQHNNQLIYDRAAAILKHNILLNSRILSIRRPSTKAPYPIIVTAQTPSGIKTILAKTLLLTIPPLLSSLEKIDLDLTLAEKRLFAQFTASGYYTSLVRIPSLYALNTTLLNVDPDTPFHLPALPCIYRVFKTPIQDLFEIEYGSAHVLPSTTVRRDLLASLTATLRATSLLAPGDPDPELVAFASHAPNLLTVSEDAVRDGFYERLYGLQGARGTYWTGASFHAHDSPFLWRFSGEIVQRMQRL